MEGVRIDEQDKLVVLFDRSPLDTLPTFVSYCKYLYSSGQMNSELYVALGNIRRVLQQNSDEIKRLTELLAETTASLSIGESAELRKISDMEQVIDILKRKMKRLDHNLIQAKDNENTYAVLSEVIACSFLYAYITCLISETGRF